MATYATSAGVAPRAGNRPLTETSKPSTTDVEGWLDEAEAELLGTLASVGIPTSYATGSAGANILRKWIEEYGAGKLRMSYAAAAGAGANADGQEQIREWNERLVAIGRNPDRVGAQLASGSAPSGASGFGSHTRTLAAADYAPVFTIKGDHL